MSNLIPESILNGTNLLYGGKQVEVKEVRTNEQGVTIEHKRGITIHRPKGASDADVQKALKQWLQEPVSADIRALVVEHTPESLIQPTGIRVEELGINWLKCGISRMLYFNWRLVAAPRKVVEYVVVHALLHPTIRSHSEVFWDLLKNRVPEYVRHKQWLDEHKDLLDIAGMFSRTAARQDCPPFFDPSAIPLDMECPQLRFENVRPRRSGTTSIDRRGRRSSDEPLPEEARRTHSALIHERSVPTRFRQYYDGLHEYFGVIPLIQSFLGCVQGFEELERIRADHQIMDLRSQIRVEALRAVRSRALPFAGTLESPLLRPVDFVPWLAGCFPLEARSWVADLVLAFTICKRGEVIVATGSRENSTESPTHMHSVKATKREETDCDTPAKKRGHPREFNEKDDQRAVKMWVAQRGGYRTRESFVEENLDELPKYIAKGDDLRKAQDRVKAKRSRRN